MHVGTDAAVDFHEGFVIGSSTAHKRGQSQLAFEVVLGEVVSAGSTPDRLEIDSGVSEHLLLKRLTTSINAVDEAEQPPLRGHQRRHELD